MKGFLFSILVITSVSYGGACKQHGFRIDTDDVNHQTWVHFIVGECKYDFYTGVWARTIACKTASALSHHKIKQLLQDCHDEIQHVMKKLAGSSRPAAGFFSKNAALMGFKEIAQLGNASKLATSGTAKAASHIDDVVKVGGKFKSVAKKLGPFGLAVTIFFLADDVQAEGVVMGVAKNVPGIDVVIEGNRTIDDVFKEINGWNEDKANAQVKISHMVAGALLEKIMGKPSGDLDPDKALDCVTDLYNGLQSSIYTRIANRPPTSIDWAFLQEHHPHRQRSIQPKINSYFSCIKEAVKLSGASTTPKPAPPSSQIPTDSH